ncbi:hypothetical protein [uncultured Serinicoccus sp.]|uniref:hypothetical protein n=1 Tax=uncultured Serinicoccus sp. TaxID=735514 RepID=UPI002615BC81|nr:hypothetical protein [uncultured Serinicoccus sp.]
MAVIALTSASGSPGVTTTALGWALTRGRPTVLVDADPTGGSPVLAGFLQGAVAPPDALVELVAAERRGDLRSTIPTVSMVLPGSQVALLPGPRSHTQARGLGGLWDPLLGALKALSGTGQDAIVDLGRLGLVGSATPLLHGADLTLVTCRSDLVSLAGARSWVQALRTEFDESGAGSSFAVVLVGAGHPYSAREVEQVLGAKVLGTVDLDAKSAAAFSVGASVRRLAASQLVGSLRRLDQAAMTTITQNRQELTEPDREAS